MGDRLGRKAAMILSLSLMGVAIIGLAITPPRATIGIVAPVLVVFFRMLQGFALGGEVGPATAFLLESAPLERRGFYTAFQTGTQNLSVLASGLVGFGLANALNQQQLQDFGWRIAFLLGAAIVPFGVIMRRSLPETLHISEAGGQGPSSLRPYLPIAVLGMMLLASASIGGYTVGYMNTYAIAALHIRANVAFGATVVVGSFGFVSDLAGGAISDRIGRRTTVLIFATLLLLAILPGFYLIVHYRTATALLLVSAVLSSLLGLSVCPMITWLTESLPSAIRSGGVATVYAVAIAVFGGTTQFAITWLVKVTGNPLAPAWYWTVAAMVGVTAMSIVHESAPLKLAARTAVNTLLYGNEFANATKFEAGNGDKD
jgi:MFS family permease